MNEQELAGYLRALDDIRKLMFDPEQNLPIYLQAWIDLILRALADEAPHIAATS